MPGPANSLSPRREAVRFAAVVAVIVAACATPAHGGLIPSALIARDATCAASGGIACPVGVPESFCCPTGNSCIALAGNTTALCCPGDPSTCATIRTIPCDVSLMNVAAFPSSNVKSTALTSRLPTCGQRCCPFGFSCNANQQCVMDKDQSSPPAGAVAPGTPGSPATTLPPAATTPATTATPFPLGAGTTSANQAPTTSAEPPADNNQTFNTTGMIIGIIVGVIGGLALAATLLFVCYRRRRHPRDSNARGSGLPGGNEKGHRHNSSTSSFGNIISDPIPQGPMSRTDFILKTPTSTGGGRLSTMFQQRGGNSPDTSPTDARGGRQQTFPAPSTPERAYGGSAAVPPIRAMRNSGIAYKVGRAPQPVTPRLQREPSSESINVFADPSTVGRDRRNTTFTDLMEEADLSGVMNHGYVPKSAQNTPRKNAQNTPRR